MSGYKRATVSISQEEYDRLREAEIRLRTIPATPRQVEQSISHESVNRLQSHLYKLQERQSRYENLINGMDGYLQEMENQTNRALAEYEANSLAEMQQYAGSLWSHYDQLLGEFTQQFNQEISAYHHQFQQELSVVSRQMRKLAGSADRKREIAAGLLDSADQLSDFLRQNYPIEQFYPERYARLEMQLEQAHMNLEVGLAEAVVVVSQQLYSAFSDLRLDLEKAEQEWRLLIQAVQETLRYLQAALDESHAVQAIDLDGNELPFTLDVHAWAPGRLEDIYDRLLEYQNYLDHNPGYIDIQTLRTWLTEDLPQLNQELGCAILDARIFAINSQLRINIADLVVQALQEQGFVLSEAEYQTNDQRQAFDARLSNLEGNEVIVTVAPTGQSIGDNELFLLSSDAEERTERELQQRWYEISRSLNHYGLAVGNFSVGEARNSPEAVKNHPANRRARRQSQQTLRTGTGATRYGN